MVESVFDRSERSGHQKKASHFQQLKKRHLQYFVHQCTEIAGFIKTGPRGPGEAQSWVRKEADRVAEGSFWSPGKSFCNRFDILAAVGDPLQHKKPNCSAIWDDTVWPRHAQESPGDAKNPTRVAKGVPKGSKSRPKIATKHSSRNLDFGRPYGVLD